MHFKLENSVDLFCELDYKNSLNFINHIKITLYLFISNKHNEKNEFILVNNKKYYHKNVYILHISYCNEVTELKIRKTSHIKLFEPN